MPFRCQTDSHHPWRISRCRRRRAYHEHLWSESCGLGTVRTCRKSAGDKSRRRVDRPRGGRLRRQAHVCGRIDRTLACPAAARGILRRDDRRTGGKSAGGRGRFYPFRDPALAIGPGNLRRRHAQSIGHAIRAFFRARGKLRIRLRRIDRADDRTIARRRSTTHCMGNELRQRAGRLVGRRGTGSAPHRFAYNCATERRHAKGGRKPADLPVFAGVSGRICQTLYKPGRGGGWRMLRHHARSYPHDGLDH